MSSKHFEKELPLNEEFDVIVAGGGPAGVAAATSAAREGASVLLIESSGMLGGMATKGLVSSWTPYTDGERIIYGGLAKRALLETMAQMPHLDQKNFDWVPIDYEVLKTVYDNMIREAGAKVLFHSTVCDLIMKDERNIDCVIVSNKNRLTAYKAKVYIDCTGDADLCAWAGNDYVYGGDDGDVQPSTMCFVITNIDEELYKSGSDLYGGNKDSDIYKILDDPEFDIPDSHLVCGFIGPGTMGFNAGHIWNIDSTDPGTVTNGNFRGREMARQFLNGLKKYNPAFRNAYLVETASTVGSRESRRIKGDYIFTTEDYFARKSFTDEIARNNYFIDIHKSEEEQKAMIKHSDERFEHYKKGESHGIPYRCLCPKSLDNVLVAGRTISSDRITQGSLRVMPCCLCEGEAVGIAAVFAMKSGSVNIHNVNINKLRDKLKSYGAYLPDVR